MIDRSLSLRSFFFSHHVAHLERTTRRDYEIQLRHFERYWYQALDAAGLAMREPTLGDLTPAHVQGAVDARLQAGRSRATADKVRRFLLAIWNDAHLLDESGEIKAPGKKCKRRGKFPEHAPEAWTVEEYGRILWAAGRLEGRVGPFLLSAWFPALLWIVYNSGLRISAAMAIRRSWINVASRRLVVPADVQKDDEARSVALLDETIDALAPLLINGKGGPFDDWPFDRNTDNWRALDRRLKKVIVDAGLVDSIEHVSKRDLWHKIRRTFATQIVIATGSYEEAQRRLGHSSPKVTERYIDKSQLETAGERELLPRPSAHRLRVV